MDQLSSLEFKIEFHFGIALAFQQVISKDALMYAVLSLVHNMPCIELFSLLRENIRPAKLTATYS